MYEHEVSGRPVQDRRVKRRHASRRRGSGPRPVRPGVTAVAVRPAEAERPGQHRSRAAGRAPLWVPGMRLIVRRPRVVAPAIGMNGRVRGFLAAAAVTAAVAALVAGLGLLCEVAAASRAQEDGATLIVTDGSLAPVLPGPGQALRVTFG
jgi:hypothetical protein